MNYFRGIHHASVLVADTGRALAFYRDVLGLEPDPARPDLGYPGVWLWVGAQQIHLIELPDPVAMPGAKHSAHAGRDRHIALTVGDLDAVRQRLEAGQILFSLSKSGRRALFCRDPDGNGLEFVELAE
ncbi:MAG: VOC family protein [Gammaproteobacteria bacterium]|nr:VOC family protein [Gammaproteobacteria bacterium]